MSATNYVNSNRPPSAKNNDIGILVEALSKRVRKMEVPKVINHWECDFLALGNGQTHSTPSASAIRNRISYWIDIIPIEVLLPT